MKFLQSFEAMDIDHRPVYDQSGKDKQRVMFRIDDRQRAKAIYDMISLHGQKYLEDTDQVMQIYFLLPEKKFEEYADQAAEKYYEEEERQRKDREEQWKNEKEARSQQQNQKQ